MNQRERILAIAVGSIGMILALYFGWTYIDGQFRTRRTKIENLEREVGNFKKQVAAGDRATKRLAEYAARSLPPTSDVARQKYGDWLLAELEKAGFTDQQVQPKSSSEEGKLYIKHIFVVTGKGTLPQVVELLHSIYSMDYLHRITTLILKPVKDSKQLDLTMHIDAVSLLTAPEATELHKQPSHRLALPKKDDYLAAIVGRNLFGPPNQPPKLLIDGLKEVAINRPVSITARGSDPDPHDKVKYRMVEASIPEAKIDAVTGRFTLTPKALGKYKFTIEAYDDGFPSKPARQEFTLNVTDPPPAGPPVSPGFIGFDDAKFTILAAVLEIDGEGEVWLNVRPKGQMRKLHVGEEFTVGSVKGTVESIGLADFTFQSDGKLRKLEKGEILAQAVVQPQTAKVEQTLTPGGP